MPGSPRPAALFAAVSLVAFSTPGCDFVGERQADTAFPRVVELKNASQDRIDLTALSSTPDAKATFFLMGKPLFPGTTRSWRIRIDAYDDIRSGRFILDGACGDIARWAMDGKAPKLQIVEQEEYGEVVVAVPVCGG